MTATQDGARETALRFRRWMDDAAPPGVERSVRVSDLPVAGPEPGQRHVLVREAFVRAEPDVQRVLDVVVVALLDRGSRPPELLVFGPEAVRARTTEHPAGLVVGDLGLGPVGSEVQRVAAALIRVGRQSRSHDVAASVEELGRLLEYSLDPVGSAAVADAVVSRLEVLTDGPAVTVSVAGTVDLRTDPTVETHHLLADAGAPVELDEDVELRDGRVTLVRGRSTSHWRGGDYLLLQVGRPPRRRTEARSFARLRHENTLREGSIGAETQRSADDYSSRAATARQAVRAGQIVDAALADQAEEATERLRAALTQPGAGGPLVDHTMNLLATPAAYWSLLPVVEAVTATPSTGGSTTAAFRLRRRLGDRLDEVLGLTTVPTDLSPWAEPIIVEVSTALVPIVDNSQDGGYFIYELIRGMRERVRESVGVVVPNIRFRDDPALPSDVYVVRIDESTVLRAPMLVDGAYTVRSIGADPLDAGVEFTGFHPLRGARGRFRIDGHEPGRPDDAVAPDGEWVTRPVYLAHRIEGAVRADLRRLLTRQGVEALVAQWRAEDPGPVERMLPSAVAVTRLALLLQDLVAEQVPVVDWRSVLGAVADAGGIAMPLRLLRRAVRLALRGQLPGPREVALRHEVPDALQATLAADGGVEVPPVEVRIEFLNWLVGVMGTAGPGIAVVTRTAAAREVCAELVASAPRTLTRTAATFTEAELEGG